MAIDPVSVGTSLALKFGPGAVKALARALGPSELGRLVKRIEKAVVKSSAIGVGNRDGVRRRVSTLGTDPTFCGCVLTLLERGDLAAEPLLRQRLAELLPFNDPDISDQAVVDAVVASVLGSLHRIPRKDRDATHLEHQLTRSAIDDLKRHVSHEIAGLDERVPGQTATHAIFNVPILTRPFVGRAQELRQLAEGVSDERAITRVDAIHGLGGVGKTQLAARYAREYRDQYDVIWWLRAERPATLQMDLAALAVALGIVDSVADEPGAVRAASDWLSRNGRWLLVFDNVPKPAAIAHVVPDGVGGHVVITSRAHADWRSLGARPIALDVWEREDYRAFLTARTDERDVDVLDALAHVLGGLPLALEQAATYTNANAISLTGYLQRLRDRGPELFAAGRPVGYEHTVATVWQLAFSDLATQPIAAGLAGVCAHLAPERIPRELLEGYPAVAQNRVVDGDSIEIDELVELMLDALSSDARASDDAIELLLRYGLLTPASAGGLGMHRLVQDVARLSAGPDGRVTGAAHAVALVSWLLPEEPWEHEHWPLCAQLLPHGLTAARHAEQHGVAREQTASVLGRLGQYQLRRAQFADALELLQHALAITEDVYGPEHRKVASTLASLGAVQREFGELEAANATHKRALAIEEQVYGPQHPRLAGALTNLGITQRELGELETARTTLQRAMEISEQAGEREQDAIANTLGSLGVVQGQLGDLEAGRATLQRALEIEERIHGSEHPSVAVTLQALGNLQLLLGEFQGARATLQRALAIEEQIYGREHPNVARTLTNLGIVLLHVGQPEPARATLQRALEIKEHVYNPDHLEVAITLANLGSVQHQLEEFEAARATLQRALATMQRIHGPEHPDIAGTLRGLGNVQLALGELQGARATLQRTLEIEEHVYGPQHPEIAKTLTNLGIVQHELREFGAAREYVERALAIFTGALGPDHAATRQTQELLRALSGAARRTRGSGGDPPARSQQRWRSRRKS